MKLKVLVDDIRVIENVDTTLRDPETARMYLATNGKNILHLIMDHDLGVDSDNGYKILSDFLEDGFRPIKVSLVTSNPVGRKNMAAVLLYCGYKQKTPSEFIWA